MMNKEQKCIQCGNYYPEEYRSNTCSIECNIAWNERSKRVKEAKYRLKRDIVKKLLVQENINKLFEL